jgi:hypothetical protein
LLGRSERTIRTMRSKDRLSRQPVPEGKHGTHYAWRTYGCRCEPCVQAHREHDRRVWRANAEVREKKAAANAEWRAANPARVRVYGAMKREYEAARTVPGAVNHKQPWTDTDLEVALDMSLTAVQAAQRLGRTAQAVIAVRTKQRDRQDPVQRPRVRQWTPEETALAADLALSDEQVAARTGRTRTAVTRKRVQLARQAARRGRDIQFPGR